MSNHTTLKAIRREQTGKSAARAARNQGQLPAIIYGGKEPVSITLDAKELAGVRQQGDFLSRLCTIEAGGTSWQVLPREVQLHPVSDQPLHVDFQEVDAAGPVRVAVRVQFNGKEKSPGLKRGGILNVVRRHVEVLCQASAIPACIEADLSEMGIGQSLHIDAVTLPEGVTPTIERNFTLATITGRISKEERAEQAEEAEEGGEEQEGESAE